MTHEEIKILLNDYFDEKLSVEVNTEIQVHLSECEECNQYLFSLQELMKIYNKLPRGIKPPADFWSVIFKTISEIKTENIKQQEELELQEAEKYSEETSEEKKKREQRIKAEKMLAWEQKKALLQEKIKKPSFIYTVIGLVSILILFIVYNLFLSSGESWEVKKLRIGSTSSGENFGRLVEDEILETNSITRLELQIPDIGSIFIEPNSKIERLKSNNIRLFKGAIFAEKGGATNFLNVETLGAKIKDYFLGGQFRLTSTEPKVSVLEVTNGWVSINKDNLETLVLPNHLCKITADSGVGLPFRIGSSNEFINSINDYCYVRPGNEEALISILTKADASNTVTLWNLMRRVNRKQREMVIYTMFGLLGEPPLGVTDDGLKILDPVMLQILIEEIELKI